MSQTRWEKFCDQLEKNHYTCLKKGKFFTCSKVMYNGNHNHDDHHNTYHDVYQCQIAENNVDFSCDITVYKDPKVVYVKTHLN